MAGNVSCMMSKVKLSLYRTFSKKVGFKKTICMG